MTTVRRQLRLLLYRLGLWLMSRAGTIIGLPNEWNAFAGRNRLLFNSLPLLTRGMNRTFIRELTNANPAQRVVFFLGRNTVEDFMEVLLACGNGYGVAGLKLLRALFERVVTAMYLAAHPDEVPHFLEYHYVHQRKAVNH